MSSHESQLNTKKRLYTFMEEHPLMVLSTVEKTSNIPQSALVAFAQTSELEVIFQTQNNTRKFKNLLHNRNVSVVIGWDEKTHITMQYQGICSRISPSELSGSIALFKQKDTPCTDEFIHHPLSVFFKITPTWIALSDYRGKKPEVLEYWPKAVEG